MKKILIDMICLTLKYMPQLLYPNKKTCKLKKAVLEDYNTIHGETSMDDILEKEEELTNEVYEEKSIYSINLGCGTLHDYQIMDAYKVNKENLNDINTFLKGKDLRKKVDIKKEANAAAVALIRINEGNGTILNYKKFQISILPIYLQTINDNIKKYRINMKKNLTITEIKEIASTLAINISSGIDNINNGIGNRNDYEIIGINNLSKKNINDINNFLNNKDLKTPNMIRNEIKRLFNALSKISRGNGTNNNYNLIGMKLESKKIKIINSVLECIYKRDKQDLSVRDIINISENIMDNFMAINNSSDEKSKRKLIITDSLEREAL
ncbi:hypothetical protein [Clostridium butyricum]|uniref:hypothetical protein n=1 Tax=Clostridium butyricum TaxID=1492 RepID=UPI00374F6D8E